MCMCVLCPVKYEHAGVKPAIDRGKRREKEAVRAAARVSLCSLTFRGKATGVCSFNSGIFLRSAGSDCLSRRACLYLSVLHSFLPPRVYERIRDFFVQLLLRWKYSRDARDRNIGGLKQFFRSHWLFNLIKAKF